MVRVLLDSHVLVFALAAPQRLSPAARSVLADDDAELFVSAVTAFELSLKHRIGKLRLSVPLERLLETEPDRLRAKRLPLDYRAARVAGDLPLYHRDPFDRMLIAQAQLEGLTLVTANAQISAYDVPVLW